MWTYVIAFTEDLTRFMMVRSKKRGGWEMPGGRGLEDESPIDTSKREFKEETGHELIVKEEWNTHLGKGLVHFGFIGNGDEKNRMTDEIIEIDLFSELPEDLAYPDEEYRPFIELGRSMLPSNRKS